MLTASVFALIVTLQAQGGAPAQTPAPAAATTSPLASARTLKCTFPAYNSTNWRDGKASTAANSEEFGFQIDAIDSRQRRARIVGTRGSAEASAFLTETGLNVIEQTSIGNFILTTIFTTGGAGDRFAAVHSRHLGDREGLPSASQHTGTCELVR